MTHSGRPDTTTEPDSDAAHHQQHRGPRLALVLAASALAVLSLVAPSGGWSQAVYMVGVTAAALLALIAVTFRPCVTAWRWIAAGVVLSTVADWVWAVQDWTSSAEWMWSNGVYYVSYLAVGIGLVRLGRGVGRDRSIDGLIEVWSVAVVVVLIGWSGGVGPVLLGDGALAERLVAAAYPVADTALLVVALWLFSMNVRQRTTALPLAFGLAMWLGGDIGFVVMERTGVYSFGAARLLDTAWLVGAFALAAAVVRSDGRAWVATPRAPRQPSWRRLALGSVLIVIPVVVESVADLTRGEEPPVAVLVAAVVLAALALARTSRFATDNQRYEQVLRSQKRRAEALAVNSSDASVVTDSVGAVTDASITVQSLLGLDGPELRGRNALDIVVEDDCVQAATLLQHALDSPGEVVSAEVRLRIRGVGRWFSVRAVSLLSDPDVDGVVMNLHDIHDRKQAEDELTHLAFHDSLTGLANRALFHDRVQHAVDRLGAADQRCVVLFIDLDSFKIVNDTLGHAAGDELLRITATRIRDLARREDTVGRLGGDEFAVLIEQVPAAEDHADDLADRILRELGRPIVLGGDEYRVHASIGIAAGDARTDASHLVRNADMAMYHAKKAGKGRSVRFEQWMSAAFEEHMRIERDVGAAIARRQMRLVFQPVVQLSTGRLQGFEALLRWTHPTLGEIPPDQFVPIAENTGDIVPIGAWVLEQACSAMVGWQHDFDQPTQLSMAVNVSAVQFEDPTFVLFVEAVLERTGLAPTDLILEITETALLVNPDAARQCLAQLRALGVRIALDDFGTGYSSLSHLQQLPVDIVKIDRGFTETISDAREVPPLIAGLLELSRSLHLDVIAEGIEDLRQLDALRHADCAAGQGFLFDRPLDRDQVALRLAEAVETETLEPQSRKPAPGVDVT